MRIEASGENFIADLADKAGPPFIQFIQTEIGQSRRLFQDGKGTDNLGRNFFCSNFKIFKASFSLSTSVFVGRYFDLAH